MNPTINVGLGINTNGTPIYEPAVYAKYTENSPRALLHRSRFYMQRKLHPLLQLALQHGDHDARRATIDPCNDVRRDAELESADELDEEG